MTGKLKKFPMAKFLLNFFFLLGLSFLNAFFTTVFLFNFQLKIEFKYPLQIKA